MHRQVAQLQTKMVYRGVAKINDRQAKYEWDGMLGPIEILGLNAPQVGVVNTKRNRWSCTLPFIMKIGHDLSHWQLK